MSKSNEFFDRYNSTHIAGRKGASSLQRFRAKSLTWKTRFGHFLPQDHNARLLDAGCGTGNLLLWLQEQGFQCAEGIDISQEQVDVAAGLGVRNVQCADLKVFLASHEGAFDVIFMRDVLEHFPKPEILGILRDLRSALAPGGCLILQVPNGASPFFGRIRYGDFTHELAFTRSSLIQLFNLAGFEGHRFDPVMPVIVGLRSLPRLIAWKLSLWLFTLALYGEDGGSDGLLTQSLIAAARRPR